jgi:hypothetical protein
LGRAARMALAPGDSMSAIRSTVWSVIIVVILIFIAMVGYGSCYNRP